MFSRIALSLLAVISFVAAIAIAIFANRLESPLTHLWAALLGKTLPGRPPAAKHYIIWTGFFFFLCLGMVSVGLGEFFDAPSQPNVTVVPPAITVVVPGNFSSPGTTSNFPPVIEEFSSPADFVQTSSDVYIEGDQVNCNVSRSGGDQFVYRSIPVFNGDFRISVIGQINSWTNNCMCEVGIGDQAGEGVIIGFGWFGGGCPTNGPTIVPAGGLSKTFGHDCSQNNDWPWFESQIPYRASVEIRGVEATFFVEGQKVDKFFGTNTYAGNYDTLWVGLRGDGDWPQCSINIESVAVEPVK